MEKQNSDFNGLVFGGRNYFLIQWITVDSTNVTKWITVPLDIILCGYF